MQICHMEPLMDKQPMVDVSEYSLAKNENVVIFYSP